MDSGHIPEFQSISLALYKNPTFTVVLRLPVCFLLRALQLPPEAWLRLSLQHGSLTLLTIRPSGHVVLRSFGDAGFMPPKSNSVV